MGAIEDILSSIDLKQLAGMLGTDTGTAEQAVTAAVPTLISGLQANATHPDGAASLAQALGQHVDGAYADSVDLSNVDTDDGRKIVAHALADDPQRLQAVSGLGGNLLSKLLPLLAPIVMSYLAKKFSGAGSSTAASNSGGSGDLLGGLLGGSAGGLGSLLGGLLGGSAGGSAAGSGGGLGDLLGDLLGGGADQATTNQTSASQAAPASTDGTFTTTPAGSDSGMTIQVDDTNDSAQQSSSSGTDILGGLLGQILGH